MAECVLVLGRADMIPAGHGDVIGVDGGARFCAERGIRMRLAIGDFDSVSPEEKAVILKAADEVIELNPVKDDSDSEAALNEVLKRGYSHVFMTGGLGGRIDHEYVNLKLAARYPGVLSLTDRTNLITALGEGRYVFTGGEYRYFSVFPLSECVISLKGMKYPLEKRKMTPEDLYGLSNEIIDECGILEVHEGTVLTMQTRDK